PPALAARSGSLNFRPRCALPMMSLKLSSMGIFTRKHCLRCKGKSSPTRRTDAIESIGGPRKKKRQRAAAVQNLLVIQGGQFLAIASWTAAVPLPLSPRIVPSPETSNRTHAGARGFGRTGFGQLVSTRTIRVSRSKGKAESSFHLTSAGLRTDDFCHGTR